jgi:hypothetical protein
MARFKAKSVGAIRTLKASLFVTGGATYQGDAALQKFNAAVGAPNP